MKRALIEKATNRFCQRVEPGVDFPVHAALEWRDCPDNAAPETHDFDGANFVAKLVPPPPDPVLVQRLATDENERADCKVDQQVIPLVNQTKAEWITWAGANFPSLTNAEKTRLGILFWVVSVGVRRSIRNGGI